MGLGETPKQFANYYKVDDFVLTEQIPDRLDLNRPGVPGVGVDSRVECLCVCWVIGMGIECVCGV